MYRARHDTQRKESPMKSKKRVRYRNLKNYKYQLLTTYTHPTGFQLLQDVSTKNEWVKLSKKGRLTLQKGYAWDGPSGPTIDTRNFMRGSLVHDGLYQLMREGLLDHEEYRKSADDLLRDICVEDGMSKFRAWYVHRAVRTSGGKNTRPRTKERNPPIYAP